MWQHALNTAKLRASLAVAADIVPAAGAFFIAGTLTYPSLVGDPPCCAEVVAAAGAGILLGAGNPLEQTILQEETPERIAGQVFTSMTAIRFAAGPIGLLAAGFLVERLSVRFVLLGGGAILLLTALVGWMIAPLPNKRRDGTGRAGKKPGL